MSFILPQYKIAYFPVPKVACTSLKLAMYKLKTGKDYKDGNFAGKSVHYTFPTADFADTDHTKLEGYWKIAVVRDPISRIISGYTNKVDRWGRLIRKRHANPRLRAAILADDVLTEMPSLIEFCLQIEKYRRHFRSMRHHTDTFATFLGPDLGYFDRIYRMEELDILCADVSARTGEPFALPHANPSKPVDRTMNAASTEALLTYCARDYEYLSNYYTAPVLAVEPSQHAPIIAP